MYYLPILFFTSLAMAQTVKTAFGVYLKHQALIDSYHQFKLNENWVSNDEDKLMISTMDHQMTGKELNAY